METQDEIDFKYLYNIILKNKKQIIILSFLLTFIMSLYIFIKPNIYQIDSVLEVGFYNKNHILEDPNTLVHKLQIQYNVSNYNITHKFPYIQDIHLIPKTKNLIYLSAVGTSKNKIKAFIETTNNSIINAHNKIIEKYKSNILALINIYHKTLLDLQNELSFKEKELHITKINIKQLFQSNPSLSAITLMEALKQETLIQNIQNKIYSINNMIYQEKLKLSDSNIQKTKVIKLIEYKDHIRPKRKLIIIISFFMFLLLSVFVFIIKEYIIRKKNFS